MSIRIAIVALGLALAPLVACSTPAKGEFPRAQELVLSTAAQHPEVVRLTLHAAPAGSADLRVVASTLEARLGTPSDPEDVVAFKSGLEVVLHEGDNLDVTIALKDATGRTIGIAGVTLKGTGEASLAQARAIAAQLGEKVAKAQPPLW